MLRKLRCFTEYRPVRTNLKRSLKAWCMLGLQHLDGSRNRILSWRAGWEQKKFHPSWATQRYPVIKQTTNKAWRGSHRKQQFMCPSSLRPMQSKSLPLYYRLVSCFSAAHTLPATGLVKTKFFGVRLGNIKRKKASNQSWQSFNSTYHRFLSLNTCKTFLEQRFTVPIFLLLRGIFLWGTAFNLLCSTKDTELLPS